MNNLKAFYDALAPHEQSALFTLFVIISGIFLFVLGILAGEAVARFTNIFS